MDQKTGQKRAKNWPKIGQLCAHLSRTALHKLKIVGELNKLCGEIINLLGKYLIPNCSDLESKVFYQKMEGDYHRYLAEVLSDPNEKAESIGNAQKAYAAAAVTVETRKETEENSPGELCLKVTSPIRLGLALNYSVFYYEILEKREEALKMAKEAFDNAIDELANLEANEYKDATLIMQLLRDNMTLWNNETEVEEGFEESEQKQYGS